MDFNPSPESEVQGLHCALGAIFVLLPTALSISHPAWFLGHPRLIGSFIGVVFAGVKEFAWDETMEDVQTRGSNLKDFCFYCVGILVANVALYF